MHFMCSEDFKIFYGRFRKDFQNSHGLLEDSKSSVQIPSTLRGLPMLLGV